MKVSVKFLLVLVLLILLPAIYFAFTIVPRQVSKKFEPLYIGKTLGDVAGDNVVLIDTSNNLWDVSNFTAAVHLVVFYSGKCEDCESEGKALGKLAKQYMKEPFRIVYVRPGTETFEAFMEDAGSKDFRLYDEDGRLTQKLGITTFPVEVLIDEEGVIREASPGFSSSSGSEMEYLQQTKIKIDSLLLKVKSTQ
jgi:hypothetical protein